MEVTFDNARERFPIALPRVVFRKVVDMDGRIRHFIANAGVTAENYYRYLEYAGVGRLPSLTLSAHRRLEEIVRLSGAEIFQTLKELTGIRVFELKRDESLALLGRATGDERRAEEMLRDIGHRLELLRHNMREYRKFEQNEQEIGVIRSLISRKKLEELEGGLSAIERSESSERAALALLQPQIEDLAREMQRQMDEVEAAERFIEEFRKLAEAGLRGDAESVAEELTVSGLEERARAEREVNAQLRALEGDLVALEKRRIEARRDIEALEGEFRVFQNSAEAANVAANKDPASKASLDARKKDLEHTRGTVQAKIDVLKKELGESQSELAELSASEAEWQKTLATRQMKLKETTAKAEDLRRTFGPVEDERLKLDLRLAGSEEAFVRVFDTLIRDATAASPKKLGVDLLHLFNVVRQFSAKNPGAFVSLLVDLVDARESLRIPLEALCLPKLFAVVVEDEQAVEKVVALNREMGGGRISVRTLSGPAGSPPGDPEPRPKGSYEDELRKKKVVRLGDWVSLKQPESVDARFGFLDFVMAYRGLAPKVDNFVDGVLNSKGLGNPSLLAFLNLALKASRARPPNLDVSLLDQTNTGDVSELSFVHGRGLHDKIEVLLRKTLRNGAVVLNLADAHRHAKEMDADCATREGEVVQAGGLLAKVGFVNPAKNAIFLYEKVSAGLHNLRAVADDLGKAIREKSSLDRTRGDVHAQWAFAEGERDKLRTQVSMATADVQFLREKMHKKHLKLGELEAHLERKEDEARMAGKILESLTAQSKTKGQEATQVTPKEVREREAQFTERLKVLARNLASIEGELVEARRTHQDRLRAKDATLAEAVTEAARKPEKNATKKNKRDALLRSMDTEEVRQRRDAINKARKRFEELQKLLRTKRDDLDARSKLHVTLVAQQESHRRRIGEIREKMVG